jgi:hypothetical protein
MFHFFLTYNVSMEHISQSQLKSALSYDANTGVFTWLKPTSNRVKAGAPAGALQNHGYVVVGFGGNHYLAHRLAWLYSYGTWPKGEVDHINRNRQDNRLANLRDTTRSENALNTGARPESSSGIKGVSWDKVCKRWRVQMRIKGKQTYVGVFKTIEEATVAYQKFAVTYQP